MCSGAQIGVVVSAGMAAPHQCVGVDVCSSSLREGETECPCPSEDGQHISPVLCSWTAERCSVFSPVGRRVSSIWSPPRTPGIVSDARVPSVISIGSLRIPVPPTSWTSFLPPATEPPWTDA